VDGRATQKGGSGGEIKDYTKRIIYTDENNSGIAPLGTALADPDAATHLGYQLDYNTWADTGTGGMDHVRSIVCPTPDTAIGSDCETRMLWLLGKIVSPDPKTDTSATTRWSVNDVLHSSPIVITYGGMDDNNNGITNEPADTDGKISWYFDRLVVGTNDGGLRFINGNTGQEEWEFIPTQVLSHQQTLYSNPDGDHIYGLDVTPALRVYDKNNDGYIDPATDFVNVYAGMRRGGNLIYALDVTPDAKWDSIADVGLPLVPKFLWRISPSTTGFSRLGQTWSPPKLATISLSGGTTKQVLIFGGGYDENLDNGFGTAPTSGSDNVGNALYVVDPDDGSLIFSISGSGSGADIEVPAMKYSVPARITILDTNGDGLDDRLYFGDTGGQVWRVDLGDDISLTGSKHQGSTVVGLLASVSTAGTATEERRFFEPPSVVQVKDTIYSDATDGEFDYVMIGSGNRARPLDKAVHDQFYAFRDRFIDGMPDGNNDNLADTGTGGYPQDSGPIDTSVMVDVTSSVLDTSDATRASSGWYYDFDSAGTTGEKALSASTAIAGGVFFTTYLPEVVNPDPCSANIGGGRAYNLHILSANSVVDWNENGTKDLADRVKTLGGGIPSDIVPVFTKEGVVGIVGVEGGAAQLGKLAGLPRYRTYWYQEQ
jgi:type IV pilus assembly protein PilY1